MDIEITGDFKKSFDKMENSGRNIFITGKAGTGKSTLLKHFRENTSKSIAVLAPTGVAALNIGGQTFHSFFHFKPGVNEETARKAAGKTGDKERLLYKSLDTIIIDEISMLRADLLDCADIFLRIVCVPEKPFGGKQLVFFGDLYQLPPVLSSSEKESFEEEYISPYFFSAGSFNTLDIEIVELEKIFRQTDTGFIKVLNAIRNNTATDGDLELLNQRVIPDYIPSDKDYTVTLSPRNDQAASLNLEMLGRISGKVFTYEGDLTGEFGEGNLPTERILELKKDAQVMLLTNDPRGRWVNGSIGRILKFSRERDSIQVMLREGSIVDVEPFEWDIFEYGYDFDSKKIITEITGSFTQYPLKLAWAITIHKSQGKTFDNMVLDIGRGAFSPGQVYVALSRVRSLEGLVLKKPLKKNHIFMDRAVVKFFTEYRYMQSEKAVSKDAKKAIIEEAIKNKKKLEIVYLKASDVKSCRIVRPISIGKMEYLGKPFEGLKAFCESRNENRTFRIDRILEIKVI